MPHNRFYLNMSLVPNTVVHLKDLEFHHLTHVLRQKEKDHVELVNGKGALAQAEILSFSKKQVELKILSSVAHPPSSVVFTLGIPIMRNSKLEWIVEKGTELGAHRFLIYPADESEKETVSSHQTTRLVATAISAMKQSGILYLPEILLLTRFEDLFDQKDPIFFGSFDQPFQKFPSPLASLIFVTGPEKGFSSKERLMLQKKGSPISLNSAILRAETAPIAAMSILGYQHV